MKVIVLEVQLQRLMRQKSSSLKNSEIGRGGNFPLFFFGAILLSLLTLRTKHPFIISIFRNGFHLINLKMLFLNQ